MCGTRSDNILQKAVVHIKLAKFCHMQRIKNDLFDFVEQSLQCFIKARRWSAVGLCAVYNDSLTILGSRFWLACSDFRLAITWIMFKNLFRSAPYSSQSSICSTQLYWCAMVQTLTGSWQCPLRRLDVLPLMFITVDSSGYGLCSLIPSDSHSGARTFLLKCFGFIIQNIDRAATEDGRVTLFCMFEPVRWTTKQSSAWFFSVKECTLY